MRKSAIAFALVALIAAGCTTTPTAPPALDLPAGIALDPALERRIDGGPGRQGE